MKELNFSEISQVSGAAGAEQLAQLGVFLSGPGSPEGILTLGHWAVILVGNYIMEYRMATKPHPV